MADIIKLLPDHVANQIAAGEVVQRPASVVKELLENAIDAKSSVIKLIIKDAGKTLIQVIDDGLGMSIADARLSFERHATSKISAADDLFNLYTKGFRGEALASIAAIAHVEMKTKQAHEATGTCVRAEGSHIVSQEAVVTPKGTSVAVKNLFYNIPARRNFLKSNTVELRHIVDEFHRVALAHPDIAFSMYHNDKDMYNVSKGHFRQRIVALFGRKIEERLIPVNETTEVLKISGFIGKPEFAKKTRGEQFFLVNHRFIKSPYLNHAICSAFEGVLKEGTHASYFLNLEVDPQTIDINIHPTKTEVKFDDEQTLYALLRSAVKHSLGQFNITPLLDFNRDPNMDTPYAYKNKGVTTPTIEVDSTFNPFNDDTPSTTKVGEARPSSYKKDRMPSWDSLYVGVASKETTSQTDFSEVHFESTSEAPHLFNTADIETQHTTYQLHQKYIISTIKSGMLVIDQHRAHQRVLYEEFFNYITTQEGGSQQLLFPLELHFSPQDMAIIHQLKDDLKYTGFVFEDNDSEVIKVQGVPIHVSENDVAMILEEIIDAVKSGVPDSNFSATDLLVKSMAKSLAIKSGQKLNVQEQEHLVNRLFACKEPDRSPFNRLTCITISVDDLEKKFI